jgi:hypothetical protein
MARIFGECFDEALSKDKTKGGGHYFVSLKEKLMWSFITFTRQGYLLFLGKMMRSTSATRNGGAFPDSSILGMLASSSNGSTL